MYQTIIIKKRSLWHRLQFMVLYYYLQAKTTYTHWATGISMLIKNETRWYYDYGSKKVLIMNGLDYLRQIRVDLGEVAYFNLREKNGRVVTTRAELF